MNFTKSISLVCLGLLVLGCQQTPKTYTYAEIKKICEEERRDAQGPRTDVTLGANSESGPFGELTVNFSDKFIRGVDPEVAYKQCMDRFVPAPAATTKTANSK